MVKDERIATIMFVDLIGSSEVASLWKLDDYQDEYLDEYHTALNEALKYHKLDTKQNENINDDFMDWAIRGDELYFIIASKQSNSEEKNGKSESTQSIRKDIITAFSLALGIKFRWLFNEKTGIERLKDLKAPFEIAIGINTGKIILEQDDEADPGGPDALVHAEGYAINLAKRVESESRKGDLSNIFVSENSYGFYSDIGGENILRFKQQDKSVLKGISGNVRIYEMIFANLDEDDEIVRIPDTWLEEWKATKVKLGHIEQMFLSTLNPWLGNVLCNLYWGKESEPLKAIDKLKAKDSLSPDDKAEIKTLSKESEANIRKAIEIARKLIEIDSQSPVWKIYLAQILFEYLYYQLYNFNTDLIDTEREKNIIFADTIRQLKLLTKKEPNEVDAWLYLSKFYLEIENDNDMKVKGNFSKDKKRKAKDIIDDAMNCLQRILMWDDEYPEAYYYIAAAMSQNGDPLADILSMIKEALKWAESVGRADYLKKAAPRDKLFKSIRSEQEFISLTN